MPAGLRPERYVEAFLAAVDAAEIVLNQGVRREVDAHDVQAALGQTHCHVAGAATKIEYVRAADKFCYSAVDSLDVAQGKESNAKIVTLGGRLQYTHPDIRAHATILTLQNAPSS